MTWNRWEQGVFEWLRDLTARPSSPFSLPELASADAPLAPLKKAQAGQRPLTMGKALAMLRVGFRQSADAIVASLDRLLKLVSPRIVVALAPEARASGDLSRETDEAMLAAADVKRWEIEARRDGVITAEERAEGRNLVRAAMRELAEADLALDALPTSQLGLSVGGHA